jgi:hypothetical protein
VTSPHSALVHDTLRDVSAALDRLHKKTRQAAESGLAPDEQVVAVFEGKSKQAMIVTDRQIMVVKPGMLAGAGLGAKVASFEFEQIAGINVHAGPRIAAFELIVAGAPRPARPDLRAAYQLPNWLPCDRSMESSPLIAELRDFVRSDGRSHSARAALSGP